VPLVKDVPSIIGGCLLEWNTIMSDKFEQYDHHGRMVWVRRDLKGLDRMNCLCFSCKKFNPGIPETNCKIANLNYAVCLQAGMVLPVYECPEFDEVE
jgi:hypothetical protein